MSDWPQPDMKKIKWLIFSGAALLSWAYAGAWSGEWKPFRATYTIYSGDLLEREAPTATDRMMTIAFEGQAAKELFESLGPDSNPACSQEKGYRERNKKGLSCTYTSVGAGHGYHCWIGLNLRTGESIPTVSC